MFSLKIVLNLRLFQEFYIVLENFLGIRMVLRISAPKQDHFCMYFLQQLCAWLYQMINVLVTLHFSFNRTQLWKFQNNKDSFLSIYFIMKDFNFSWAGNFWKIEALLLGRQLFKVLSPYFRRKIVRAQMISTWVTCHLLTCLKGFARYSQLPITRTGVSWILALVEPTGGSRVKISWSNILK